MLKNKKQKVIALVVMLAVVAMLLGAVLRKEPASAQDAASELPASSDSAAQAEPEASSSRTEEPSTSEASSEENGEEAASDSAEESESVSDAASSDSQSGSSASNSTSSKETSSSSTSASHSTAASSHSTAASSSHSTTGTAASSSSSTSHTSREERAVDARINVYIQQMEALKKKNEKQLYGTITDAYSEYMSHDEKSRTLTLKISIVLGKASQLNKLQSQCDQEFNAIIKELRQYLKDNGRDQSIADEAEKEYKAQKDALIKELTNITYSQITGKGEGGKWIAEHASMGK